VRSDSRGSGGVFSVKRLSVGSEDGWKKYRHRWQPASSIDAEERSSFPVYDLPAIDIRKRERPHVSELSRDTLQATPDEINHETCLGGRFLDSTSDANLSESEKAVPLHDAARHLACPYFQALAAKFYKSAQAGDS
jgi:hypothetical protein